MPRPFYGLLLLVAAIGGPYTFYETSIGNSLKGAFGWATSQVSSATSAESQTDTNLGVAGSDFGLPPTGKFTSVPSTSTRSSVASASVAARPNGIGNATAGSINNLNYPPIRALQEVLRFDISPNWIPQRFPRVSTVLADMRLDGMRVPLVTGTSTSDLAGTLTYYFDKYKRVQRITVHAVTGDPSRFIAEMQHTYQLQQQPTLRSGLFLKKWNGRATSVVYTTPAAVISADQPYARYELFIELNQPGLEFGISPEAQQLLASGQTGQAWN